MWKRCKICGEDFRLSKSEIYMIDHDELSYNDITMCPECEECHNNTDFEYEQQSDADPGL